MKSWTTEELGRIGDAPRAPVGVSARPQRTVIPAVVSEQDGRRALDVIIETGRAEGRTRRGGLDRPAPGPVSFRSHPDHISGAAVGSSVRPDL
jgi:hypothetical protein